MGSIGGASLPAFSSVVFSTGGLVWSIFLFSFVIVLMACESRNMLVDFYACFRRFFFRRPGFLMRYCCMPRLSVLLTMMFFSLRFFFFLPGFLLIEMRLKTFDHLSHCSFEGIYPYNFVVWMIASDSFLIQLPFVLFSLPFSLSSFRLFPVGCSYFGRTLLLGKNKPEKMVVPACSVVMICFVQRVIFAFTNICS